MRAAVDRSVGVHAACTWRVPNSDRLITPAGRVDDAHVVSGCQLVKVRATVLAAARTYESCDQLTNRTVFARDLFFAFMIISIKQQEVHVFVRLNISFGMCLVISFCVYFFPLSYHSPTIF